MCGIAGIIGNPQGGGIRRMTETLAHRGPDGEGYFISPRARLGHRRLSVIDLATGQQPMTTAGGRYTIVFNGEIYNFCELRRELESCGARFRTRSDCEVLLEAYARWGRACLEKPRGMFAFAVWDAKEQSLFAARDRLGMKPFYYSECAATLLFASEMKALLAHPAIRRELDPAALDDYLTYLYVPAPRTIFRHIRELPPAHWIAWKDGRLSTGQYWDVRFEPEARDFVSCVEELKQILNQAVRARLTSDVPLGVFLSGGLDSGSIAALMARQIPGPVKTFTLGFAENARRFDERADARTMAESIGAEGHEQLVNDGSVDLLAEVTRHFDEPFGNPTSLLVYQLSAAARRHLTVALTGDGGDEALLGYPRYRGTALAEWYRKTPGCLRSIVGGAASRWNEPANGNHFRRRLREFLTAGSLPPEQGYFEWISYFSHNLRQHLYTPEFKRELGDYDSSEFITNLFSKSGTASLIDRVNYADLHSFLPYNVLRYADRMSMAHGLEIRCPFTDHLLIEFLARVPWQHKLRITESKCLLREAAQSWLPKRILTRKKLGLNPPMGLWLRSAALQRGTAAHNGLKSDELVGGHRNALLKAGATLAPDQLRRRGYFRPETVERLITDHFTGRRDYSLHLWALISFEEWHRQYLDPAPRPAEGPHQAASPILQPA